MNKKHKITLFPIVMGKEGKWYVASCPLLDVATQGLTEEETRENIKELIQLYLSDPDTLKPDFSHLHFPSLSYIELVAPSSR